MIRSSHFAAAFGLAAALTFSFASGPALAKDLVPQSMGQVNLTFAPIVKKVQPAVVNVYARTVVRQQVNPFFNDPFFRQFFGASPQMRKRVQQSLGSA